MYPKNKNKPLIRIIQSVLVKRFVKQSFEIQMRNVSEEIVSAMHKYKRLCICIARNTKYVNAVLFCINNKLFIECAPTPYF